MRFIFSSGYYNKLNIIIILSMMKLLGQISMSNVLWIIGGPYRGEKTKKDAPLPR